MESSLKVIDWHGQDSDSTYLTLKVCRALVHFISFLCKLCQYEVSETYFEIASSVFCLLRILFFPYWSRQPLLPPSNKSWVSLSLSLPGPAPHFLTYRVNSWWNVLGFLPASHLSLWPSREEHWKTQISYDYSLDRTRVFEVLLVWPIRWVHQRNLHNSCISTEINRLPKPAVNIRRLVYFSLHGMKFNHVRNSVNSLWGNHATDQTKSDKILHGHRIAKKGLWRL